MQQIKLRRENWNGEPFVSTQILRQVVEYSPQRPLTIPEMRNRVKILDQLDALAQNAEVLLLEDEQHACLAEALKSFLWNRATPPLLAIIDDALNPTGLVAGEGVHTRPVAVPAAGKH